MDTQVFEYSVIGAGPAGIVAVAKLVAKGIPGKSILWVDPQFTVGDFGGKLSEGSSVPGNTSVASYEKVNNAIYEKIPACHLSHEEKMQFEIAHLSVENTCPLKIAAVPLQKITQNLRQLVFSMEGLVLNIETMKNNLELTIQNTDNHQSIFHTKRAVLALGAHAKTLSLKEDITIINPDIAFIQSHMENYARNNPSLKKAAVIGSSHSAALAVMHLLQTGIPVKQLMNKEYKFAKPMIHTDGTHYTQFDNTGLKGEVAKFTRDLLDNPEHPLAKKWECHISPQINTLMDQLISDCSHAVICIGYTPRYSLTINGICLKEFTHHKHTTQILGPQDLVIPGMFGIGVAFPPEVTAKSGEVEFAVGVGKFWEHINDNILKIWENSI